ncbi:MAG TPA: sulfotransferase, partial [Methyloceanibacter sp.]|nr:sulfotransferase [Methyloceanibacter sp.]
MIEDRAAAARLACTRNWSMVMTLKVIGAGFGRTCTLSLKSALDELGLGPCYHMVETQAHPEHNAMWLGLARGDASDWRPMLKGYASTVDWRPPIFGRTSPRR